MNKKLFSTLASVALLMGMLTLAAPVANAAVPFDTQNFLPTDGTVDGDGQVLSDRFDGVDATAHLTNVSTADAERVKWFACSDVTPTETSQTVTQTELETQCTTTIGEDTTPRTPPGGSPFAPIDEAYDVNWNIPGDLDGETVDILAIACIGAGDNIEGAGRNCAYDVEQDVVLEDGQTGEVALQTTSGEMATYCTSDADGGPNSGTADVCQIGGTGAGTDAAVGARFEPFPHGSSVPNDGFVMRVFTSNDVDVGDAWAVLDPGTDAQTEYGGDLVGTDCALLQTGTNFKQWECVFDADAVPDDAEAAVYMTDDEELVLDSHYIVSSARQAASVVATFWSDDDLTEQEQCADPDDAETNNLDDPETVLFCVTDQFGDPFDTSITFESTGPSSAGFDGTADCVAQNHDDSADGVDEHCDGSTGSDGIASVTAVNPDDHDPGEPAVRGVQTITACVEGEPTATDPAHGCADEPANLKDTVAKTWESNATVVRLVFGDKTANCITGPTFKENLVGDFDNLKACTYDKFGNPTSTTGTDDGFLEWSIDTGADDEVDTQFVGLSPSETDADGEAVAVIEAIDPGNDNPTVSLRSDTTGELISTTSWDKVQKNVRARPGGEKTPSTISIRHRKHPHRFQGRVRSSDASCVSGRNVVLKRVKRGRDRTIGTDVTNARGKYRIRHRKTRVAKRYYTKVRGTSTCGGKRSRTLRRR